METRLESPNLYTIGWIAALPIELAAATALLDEHHVAPEYFEQRPSDTNSYTWGRIGEHNVVIASLPAGVYGITSAATTASNLIHSLPHIRIGLLVGIGGGIARPDLDHDIRLGDVVVSQPDGTTGGVVQYDFGKAKANGAWERKGSLDKPPLVLLSALGRLQAQHEQAPSKVPDLLQKMVEANPYMKRPKKAFTYQGAENDRLFESQHDHVGGSNCDKCDSAWEVKRDRRESTDPEIHYGIIASGNTLIKDAATRDSLLEDTGHQCLCVEMEAAGLMDRFPCLVIRGICDYADSHKNDRWQRYAAATAAAFAVELLDYVPAGQLEATEKVAEVLHLLEQKINNLSIPIHNLNYRTALNQLPIAEGASFDSRAEEHNPTCLPDTRVELLNEISCWIDDTDAKTIFWLSGMAGTGKSTISRTVARRRHERGDLGGSFFFKRGETDRGGLNKFVTTLARQLASRFPDIAPLIKKAIDADPEVVDKTVKEQFDNLIREPLASVAAAQMTRLSAVMVIDALDECDGDADIKLLLSLLSSTFSTGTLRIRVLITSRPELRVRLGFRSIDGTYQDLVLHQFSEPIIERDIAVFLRHEFNSIRENFNNLKEELRLPVDWPREADLMKLTRAATPLFIFAATICRFISDTCLGSPDKLLQSVLHDTSNGHASKLDMTYSPVLKQQVIKRSGRERRNIIESFRLIVGAIVTLASPLSVRALALLLNVHIDEVTTRLRMLHSVLEVPASLYTPVRLLHLSFRDYLVDPGNKDTVEFWVDEKLAHRRLAKHCLRVMRGGLRENMCGLSFPGMRRFAVDLRLLEKSMPSQLQYACMHWAYHQTKGDPKPNNDNEVLDFLTAHFLHWLEAMSLLGRVKECLDSLRSLARWLENREDSRLSTFMADAVRFLQAYFSVIAEAPLQIYSCLVFAPSKSVVRNTFEHAFPKWISNLPKVEGNWDACLLTLEGHSDWVVSVVFSHDSKKVASASPDKTMRIWNAETGQCERVLEGHSNSVNAVVFSHGSIKVALASHDKTVRIWDVETGECEQVLKGHSDWVVSVVFSHDSKKIASGSWDKTIRIWNAETGECERVLEGHSNRVESVVFSHNSKKVASASDKTIRIWDAETGECERELEGHSHSVSSMVFSHDSKKVASASHDKTVRIWNAETGECEWVLKGHSNGVVSVVFSHNSKKVASASDKTIRIWDAETGECERELEGHSRSVDAVVFSHDSKKVASASHDKTVRIWDAETGECEQVLKGHINGVVSVVFSHDSKKIASGSWDKTVRIWNAETGQCGRVLEGHIDRVWSVVFSHDSKKMASASASDDKTIRIWNAETGECERVLEGHIDRVWSVVFSHNSKKIASGSWDKTIRIWDAETGVCEQVLKGHIDRVCSVVFSQDSKKVASGSWDETIRIWNAKTGKCERELEGHIYRVWSVVFSHNSKKVASASHDKTVRIWNAETGECERELGGHSRSVNAVVFSHNSQKVASGSDDRTVRIWNAETGKCEWVLKGHSRSVNSVVFSHNSQKVASGSDDRTVRIWNSATGECEDVVPLDVYAYVISFTPDGRGIITNRGVFPLTGGSQSHAASAMLWQSSDAPILACRDSTWVTAAGKDLLWLPPECRNGKTAVSGSTVVIGCLSGRVVFLGISMADVEQRTDT